MEKKEKKKKEEVDSWPGLIGFDLEKAQCFRKLPPNFNGRRDGMGLSYFKSLPIPDQLNAI